MLPRPPTCLWVSAPASMVTLIARQTTFPVAAGGISLQVTINSDTLAEGIAMPQRLTGLHLLFID